MTARVRHQQRVAVNAEGRFLAHWDEFVEHRREAEPGCAHGQAWAETCQLCVAAFNLLIQEI